MDVEKEIGKMLQQLSRIEAMLANALSDLEDHEARLRCLEQKGGKRWESLVGQIITLLVAGFAGWLLSGNI